jgi:hypothetical protein
MKNLRPIPQRETQTQTQNKQDVESANNPTLTTSCIQAGVSRETCQENAYGWVALTPPNLASMMLDAVSGHVHYEGPPREAAVCPMRQFYMRKKAVLPT